jgi:hypothetical protein
MPTKQEIFDTVVTHLFTQGKAAQDEDETCFYRAPDGCKCAVGALIPDELYDETMEYNTWIHFSEAEDRDRPDMKKVFEFLGGEETYELISDLQRTHDRSDNWASSEKLRNVLLKVAAKNQVSSAVLEGLQLPQ